MIEKLEIQNFKSIERLELDCRRVNVFIGEPNTGKSNILEALGLISYVGHANGESDLRDFVRCDHLVNLFNDGNLDEPLKINAGSDLSLTLQYRDDEIVGRVGGTTSSAHSDYALSASNGRLQVESPKGKGGAAPCQSTKNKASAYKFYRYARRTTFPSKSAGSLVPPSGSNLLTLLSVNRDVAEIASIIFGTRELALYLRRHEDKLEAMRNLDELRDPLVDRPLQFDSDPYHMTSDTFQSLVFHMAALETNSNACLIFEEPETHVFPYNAKYLAERIALDERDNQFFITTHDPYFLLPLIEKTLMTDIAVFITYYEDYRTKVKQMPQDDISMILGEIDVFLNVEMFLEDE